MLEFLTGHSRFDIVKLIATPASPFCRKVRIVLAEKHIDYTFVVDSPGNPATRVHEFNPLGKIPVLLLDDDTTLFDSRVIVEYLDAANPVNRLIPDAPRERLAVKRREALADGCLDAAVEIVVHKRRPPELQNSEWLLHQHRTIERAVGAMADELGEREWSHGNAFSLADIANGCALGCLDFRIPDIQWRKTHPLLADYADRLAQRASFAATQPRLVEGISIDYVPPPH